MLVRPVPVFIRVGIRSAVFKRMVLPLPVFNQGCMNSHTALALRSNILCPI